MKKTFMMIVAAGLAMSSQAGFAQPPGGILKLDSDGDGRVSREEFRPPEERRGPRLFERADANNDGMVSRDEMQAAIDAAGDKQQRMQDKALTRFDAMDLDGNGMVSNEEAKAYAFTRADADGDGYITEAEAEAMHAQRKAMHKQRKGQQ
jgi:Ca2+-binding EF-hand superfamily protein